MSNLDDIRARVADCKTYNFGMHNADKLAHEDAPRLLAAVEAVDFALSRYEASGIFIRPAEDIRYVMNLALEGK